MLIALPMGSIRRMSYGYQVYSYRVGIECVE